MTPHREWIRDMEPCKVPVRLANNDVVWATGRGNVVFNPIIGGRPAQSVEFSRVLYVPDLESNLFSVLSAVRRSKLKVVIEGDSMSFLKDGEPLFTGSIRRNVGTLDGTTLDHSERVYLAKSTRSLLHQRLGHIGKDRLERLLREGLADGVTVDSKSDLQDLCEHCIAGKQHRDPFPHASEHRSTELLGRIHSDLHGPLPRTPYGYQYWMTLVDDYSRYKSVYLLKKKSDAFAAFKEFVAKSERELNLKVKELRDDKGGEYMGSDFDQYCKDNGISRQHTVKATPQQNPVAERLNRTLAEGVTAMLNQANLPVGYWAQAVLYLTHILNVTPSSALSETTSYEVWKKRKPDLKMYRVFGCRAFVNILKKERTALASHTQKCIFLGFEDGYKGWKVYDPAKRTVFTSRDIIFDEKSFPGTSAKSKTDESSDQVRIRDLWPDSDDELAPAGPPDDQPPPAPPGPGAPVPDEWPPLPPVSPQTPSDDDDRPAPAFSPGWEVGKNRTGRPLTQITPPRYATEPPSPERHAQRMGERQGSPSSPLDRRSAAPRYSQIVGSPPRSPSPVNAPHFDPNLLSSPEAPRPAAPLVARNDRPIRSGRIMDYAPLDGRRRRTTQPVARRQCRDEIQAAEDELERQDVVVGHGQRPGGDPAQVVDRGGAQDQDYRSLPVPSDEIDEDDQEALQATPIIDSVNYVYGQSTQHIPLFDGFDIAFEMAAERAYGAAVRPEDSPSGWKEAMARPDREKWMEAAQIEINALLANGTWELVELPAGRRAIGSRWVFLVKRQSDGTIDRYKARLVARGDNQRPGIDYDQVFAPTARLGALRSVLAMAALAGDHIESIDISNAYLNGELEKEFEVYMRQPEGFQQHGPNGEQWVCRLMKGLYGLKQGGRLWYQKLGDTLDSMGFTQIQSDPSIYVWVSDGVRIILPVFVDNITIVSQDLAKITSFKESLRKIFKIKELGPLSYLLGIKIDYDQGNRVLQLSQRQYAIDCLTRFKLSDCNPVATPMDPGVQLSKAMCPTSDAEREEMRSIPYMNAVGALMYLAIATRPDIAYTVGKLARFNSDPGRRHWQAVKHVFRYIKGTLDLKLTYRAEDSPISSHPFIAYSDSDYAGCPDTRCSTSGYVLKIGSGAVSWSSKKQATVAASSTEAEYIAAVNAAKEILWMRTLLRELHYQVGGSSPMLVDNQSALAAAQNPEHHGRMKHINVNYHWIRQVIRRKQIAPQYLPTGEMTADILTKALPRLLVERHRLSLGVM